jgi:hypothetical protein
VTSKATVSSSSCRRRDRTVPHRSSGSSASPARSVPSEARFLLQDSGTGQPAGRHYEPFAADDVALDRAGVLRGTGGFRANLGEGAQVHLDYWFRVTAHRIRQRITGDHRAVKVVAAAAASAASSSARGTWLRPAHAVAGRSDTTNGVVLVDDAAPGRLGRAAREPWRPASALSWLAARTALTSTGRSPMASLPRLSGRLRNVVSALEAAGATPADVARLAIYLVEQVDPREAYAVLPGIAARNLTGYRGAYLLRRTLDNGEVEFSTIMLFDAASPLSRRISSSVQAIGQRTCPRTGTLLASGDTSGVDPQDGTALQGQISRDHGAGRLASQVSDQALIRTTSPMAPTGTSQWREHRWRHERTFLRRFGNEAVQTPSIGSPQAR